MYEVKKVIIDMKTFSLYLKDRYRKQLEAGGIDDAAITQEYIVVTDGIIDDLERAVNKCASLN